LRRLSLAAGLYRPAKHGNIPGRNGVPRVHSPEIAVSDVIMVIMIAATKAAKTMSFTADSRRSFMPDCRFRPIADSHSGALRTAFR
jgi:hypothetical protein